MKQSGSLRFRAGVRIGIRSARGSRSVSLGLLAAIIPYSLPYSETMRMAIGFRAVRERGRKSVIEDRADRADRGPSARGPRQLHDGAFIPPTAIGLSHIFWPIF